ncbi:hypothetical protein P3X46_013214 [Hevea brasiliensis]|uniref:NB-ARC domain-containing protein n=1 Tax=Hevea brasiliensis TaxID=3981 RepID=A0ABQ9M6Q3_HEVBR|nr:putative disease resistance protein At3g14460 [Hevea brasiliensis]KAJ9174579.1 hypothetical protein P3X46_013214 [Hevea brasiliensis]
MASPFSSIVDWVAGERFASAFLRPLLDRLEEDCWRYDHDARLETNLTDSLRSIKAFLEDADDKQFASIEFKKWLEKLNDAVYNLDDLLDKIATDAAQQNSEAKSQNPRSWKRKLSFTKKISPKPYGKRMGIKVIARRIKSLEREAERLGLVVRVIKRNENAGSEPVKRFPSTDSIVCGRHEDKEKIVVKLLQSHDASHDGIPVIFIVGTAGLGKTTLAQLAFNDQRLKTQFDLKVWVYVGDDFDVRKVMKIILATTTGQYPGVDHLDLLKLNESLFGKKLLLVLDDILKWNDDSWNTLRKLLRDAAKGSRIVITTTEPPRDMEFKTSIISSYKLKPLSTDECFSLLVKQAFREKSPSSHQELVEIGKQIAARCEGLPLAAKALGSILRSKRAVEDWKAILENSKGGIPSALRLSYSHLPANLKRCFAYCSIFPRGYEFEKEKLVRLWMAEGFLQQPKNRREEDAGDDYFLDLLSSSFFQYSSTNKSCFVMHDLISDFAQLVSKEFCFRLEDGISHMREKILHASYTRGNNDPSDKFKLILTANRLRTFLMIDSPLDHKSCHLSKENLHDLFSGLTHLRVFSLAFYGFTKVPDSIGKLKHLRYLDLSHTALEILPESVSSLYNLQTLDLSYCHSLSKLPQGMVQLVNLRHLLITKTNVQCMPLGMSRLTNLQTLSNFIVGECGSKVNELSGLSDIRGTLSISKLHNLDPDSDPLDAKLTAMRYLDELELEWNWESGDPKKDEKVLENLEPPQKLKRLVIKSYGGTGFPWWLGNSSFADLVFLSLSNCKDCLQMPSLGNLPSLEVLEIEGLSRVTRLGVEFYGTHCLKTLKFNRMLAWEEWETDEIGDGKFPCLDELLIINCPNLKGHVPKSLPSLTKLVISNCPKLVDSLRLQKTSAKCDIFIDDKKIQPRSEDEDPLPVYPEKGVISSCAQEFQTASESPTHVASQSSLQTTRATDVDVAHQADDQAKAFDSFLWISKYSDNGQLEKQSHVTDISSRSEKVGSQTALDSTKQTVDLQSAVHTSATATITHQADDQAKVFDSSPGSSKDDTRLKKLPQTTEISSLPEKFASETTPGSTSHDVALQFSPLMTKMTADSSTYQADIGVKPFLSHDGMQHQYSSPGILKVSDIAELSKLPTDLHSLRIEGCDTLESFRSEILSSNPFLQHLYVIDCGSLISFAEGAHPTALKTLHFRNCRKLNFLFTSEMLHQFADLEHLCIGSSCDSLESFPLDFFPKLKILCLWDCMNLNSLSIQKAISLESLDALEIRDCPNLVYFPSGGLLAPNLTSAFFSNCKNLKSLPRQMCRLESLQSLFISNCPELESLPNDDLPARLNLLCITSCDKITLRKELELNRLDALSHLEIEGGCVNIESFPEKGLLPANLISLRISRLLNLKFLDQEGLQQLTFLEKLEISCCKRLRSLPEKLPNSLSSISIKECPLLKARLRNKRGTDWSRIAHIPSIFIDEEESH